MRSKYSGIRAQMLVAALYHSLNLNEAAAEIEQKETPKQSAQEKELLTNKAAKKRAKKAAKRHRDYLRSLGTTEVSE